MKASKGTFKVGKHCKHSIVFESTDENAPASSVYIQKAVIPIGATECKITVCFPDGGQDEVYKNL